MSRLTGEAVLDRARESLLDGPLPEFYSAHGEWCPWCAMAQAMTDLIVDGGDDYDYDEDDSPAMRDARSAVSRIIGPQRLTLTADDLAAYTQGEAIEILTRALGEVGASR